MEESCTEPKPHSPMTFQLLSQETIIEADFSERKIHGVTSMELEISSKQIIPCLNFHIGLLAFVDERPNCFNQALQLCDAAASSESLIDSKEKWRCPKPIKDHLHGHASNNTKPGPPLHGSLYLCETKDMLDHLPDDLKQVSLEIHFSLSMLSNKPVFQQIETDVPLFGHGGIFFFTSETEPTHEYLLAGPCVKAGYLGTAIPSVDLFMPIMSLHLNAPISTYVPANRTVPKWKLSIIPSSLSQLSSIEIVAPGLALPPMNAEERQVFTFSDESNTIIPWAVSFVAGSFTAIEVSQPSSPMQSMPKILAYAPYSEAASKFLIQTLEYAEKAVEYYQWMLQIPYPWPVMKIVFTGGLVRPFYVMSGGLILIDRTLLVGHHLIDEVYESREAVFLAIALQFSTMVMSPEFPSDLWISLGIASFLADGWLRRIHGENWGRLRMVHQMAKLCEIEADLPALSIGGPIDEQGSDGGEGYLEPKKQSEVSLFLDGLLAQEAFFEFYLLKAGLIFKAIEVRIGAYAMAKTLSSFSSFITHTKSEFKDVPSDGIGTPTICRSPEPSVQAFITIINVSQFFRLVRKVSGKDLRPFADQWVYAPGHAILSASFGINRKKCAIEIRISQETMHPERGQKFCGPLKIRVQETDRFYDHIVHVEDASHFFELPYHSKYKKSTASGMMTSGASGLAIGALEQPTDAAALVINDDESPVLWIRIDPDHEWLRKVVVEQPEFMWLEQLERDRDVVSQAEALEALALMPSEVVLKSLEKVAMNWKNYHEIRTKALEIIASIATTLPHMRNEVIAFLLSLFESKFAFPRSSLTDPVLPKPNSFDSIPLYFIQKKIICLLGKIKDDHGKTPPELLSFITQLLRLNDNSQNSFSDGAYVAALLTSLVEALVPASKDVFCRPDPQVFREALEELERYRFLDIIRPSHNNIVTVALLQCLIKLQQSSLLSLDESLFSDLVLPGNGVKVREAALEGLVLVRYKDEDFVRDLLVDASSPLLTEHKIYSDAVSFSRHLFKTLRKAMFVSSYLTSMFQSVQMKALLARLLKGALVSRDLEIFSMVVAISQTAFSSSVNGEAHARAAAV